MRTDSTRVSNDALTAVRDYIKGNTAFLGPRYLPNSPNAYKSGKSAQEGHEAIRPTDVKITPKDAERAGLGGDQLRLYTLIWQRFVASQCAPAEMEVTTYEITAGRGLFRANGRVIKFDGYRKVLEPAGGKQEDTDLPKVDEKETLDRLDLFETQHFTQPPPRFNEGSLVKALEKEGIGRPSTYASIISTIQRRGYVTQDRGRFYATEIGKVVTDLLVKHFPKIMDLQFTSGFEEKLDHIEDGQHKYTEVLNEFWDPFSKDLKKADTEMESARTVTDIKCPRCGVRFLESCYVASTGGYFLGCTGWKDKENPCTYKQGSDGKEIEGPSVTDIECPACGKFMVKKEGRFGTFYTCEGAPECPTTMNLNAEGKPVVTALPTKVQCPRCQKHNLLLKESKAGRSTCSARTPSASLSPTATRKGIRSSRRTPGSSARSAANRWRFGRRSAGRSWPARVTPSAARRSRLTRSAREAEGHSPADAGEGGEEAVGDAEGGNHRNLHGMRREDEADEVALGPGYYLACTKYPDCKGTKKVTPELQAQIDAAAQQAPQQGRSKCYFVNSC